MERLRGRISTTTLGCSLHCCFSLFLSFLPAFHLWKMNEWNLKVISGISQAYSFPCFHAIWSYYGWSLVWVNIFLPSTGSLLLWIALQLLLLLIKKQTPIGVTGQGVKILVWWWDRPDVGEWARYVNSLRLGMESGKGSAEGSWLRSRPRWADVSRQKDYVLRRYGVLGKLSRWAFSRRRTILDTGSKWSYY